MSKHTSKAKLEVRVASLSDVKAIVDLVDRAYPEMPTYSSGMIQGQLNAFSEGQFVVLLDGLVVGYAASFLIDEASVMRQHTWSEITGGGYAARHDPNGTWLYGMEVCVDPTARGRRIGQRLYEARKRLAEQLDLNGIVFGGRMSGYAGKRKRFETPQDYVAAVAEKQIRDQSLNFQMRNGFEPVMVLENYLPVDVKSGGHGVLMVWRNPYADETLKTSAATGRDPESVRVATVQFQQRAVSSFEEFISNVEYFVDVVADYKADFVVFPELFTLQLLAFEKRKLTPEEAIETLTAYTPRLVESLSSLAISYNINIIGGSHPTRTEDGDIQNIAYVLLRDGSVHVQEKIHPTPNERYWWNIKGGDETGAIQTDCGPIGVLICYDSEFPELARRLVDEGARILFVPFCTDNRQAYLRVRYCCHARAIENQCYVVMSGNVGNLPNVDNMDIQFAQSCILTPCDFPFARDGVAAEATENVEIVTIADLNLSDLTWARAQGTVRNLRDRRFDLYQIQWSK